MVRCGKSKGRCKGIWYGCGGQGAYVRFRRCPSGAFMEVLVILMRFNGRSSFRGKGVLSATAIETWMPKMADR